MRRIDARKRDGRGRFIDGAAIFSPEMFWAYVDRRNAEGCWNWIGGINSEDYPQFLFEGRTQPAHRVAYKLIVGQIPKGLVIDHLCRNTHCVNPQHLEAVTSGENVLRGIGPTAMQARQTHCKRGHSLENAYTPKGRSSRNCRICQAARCAAWKERRDHAKTPS